MGESCITLGSIRRDGIDGRSGLVAELNTAWPHWHLHKMSVGVVWARHSQANNANHDDENGDECDDASNNTDYQSVIVTHRLLNLRKFCLDLGRLSDRNAPNDVRFLGGRTSENSR